MQTIEVINAVVVAVGVPSIIVSLIFIGRKLQILDGLVETVERIKGNLKVIGDALMYADIAFDRDKLRNYSPVSVTDGGIKYLQKMGFLKLYENHKDDFIDYIKSEGAVDEFDVEVAARKSILALFRKPYFREIKDRLYNSNRKETSAFLKAAGIYVRDRYLEK